jgi:hypothetical protein
MTGVYKILVGKSEEKGLLANPDANGRIILSWIFMNWEVVLWTGLIWLRIETVGGQLRVR